MAGIFPAFETPVPGVDTSSITGRGLSHSLEALDKIVRRLEIQELSTFIDSRTMMEEIHD